MGRSSTRKAQWNQRRQTVFYLQVGVLQIAPFYRCPDIRYSRIPNSASFIRPSASINIGCSFLQALSSKYVEIPLETSNEKVVLGSSKGAIKIEAVGMNKVRSKLSKLERLREVSLDNENVARGDGAGEIRSRCPSAYGCPLSRSAVCHSKCFQISRAWIFHGVCCPHGNH